MPGCTINADKKLFPIGHQHNSLPISNQFTFLVLLHRMRLAASVKSTSYRSCRVFIYIISDSDFCSDDSYKTWT